MENNKLMSESWVCEGRYGRKYIDPQKLYLHLKNELNLLYTNQENRYLYQDGYYRRLGKNDFIAIIKEYMSAEIRSSRDWEEVYKEFTTDKYNVNEEDLDSDENLVPFQNGVFNVMTGELAEHDPKYLFTRKVHANYLKGKTLENAPAFKKFMSDMLSGDPQELTFLLEFIGAILSNVKGWRFKKMLLLVGKGNTGKSKLRELVVEMLGHENEASIDLHNINARFGTSTLHHKRLAGSGDMSFVEINEMANIKQLVGGDRMFGERKGKDAFDFRYDGLLWFNANALPKFGGDKGDHVYSRFCIVECLNVIPEEKRDPLLLEKLLEEKDVIASVAMDYLKAAIERGYKFDECEIMRMNREKYEITNDSFLTFIEECCEKQWGKWVNRPEFNNAYRNWCRNNGIKDKVSPREIGLKMREKLGYDTSKANGTVRYNGIALRKEFQYLTYQVSDAVISN